MAGTFQRPPSLEKPDASVGMKPPAVLPGLPLWKPHKCTHGILLGTVTAGRKEGWRVRGHAQGWSWPIHSPP